MNMRAGDSDFPRQSLLGNFGTTPAGVWPGTLREIEAAGLEIDSTRSSTKGSFGAVLFCREKLGRERPGDEEVELDMHGRKLVVKVLLDPDSSEACRQFNRELAILSSDHGLDKQIPFFVRARARTADSQPFLVMESIDGQHLKEDAAERSLKVEDKLEVIRSLFAAYAEIHQTGLIHGDPSFKNVLIDRQRCIRTIDWGSGRSQRSHLGQRSITTIAGTASVADRKVLAGLRKASTESDLLAVANMAYILLTGDDQRGSDLPEANQLRRLDDVGVPRAYAWIIVRCLRIKDPTLADDVPDPRLFSGARAVVEAMDAVRRGRETRRRLLQRTWPVAALTLVFGLALFVTFGWMRDARLLAQQAEQAELETELRQVANQTDPAVMQALQQLDELKRKTLDDARTSDRATREKLQTTLIGQIKEVLRLSRDVERQRAILQSLGQVLEVARWTESAPTIAKSLQQLRADYQEAGAKLTAGATSEVDRRLIDIQSRLAAMTAENEAAHQAELVRSAYVHELQGVSPRVLAHASYARVKDLAADAEAAWVAGEFVRVKQLFGQSTQRLNELLSEIETPEERIAREQKQTGQLRAQLAEVEQRLQGMRGERDGAMTEVGQLKTQITTLTGQHAAAIANLEAERQSLQGRLTAAETKVVESERKSGEATKLAGEQKKKLDEQTPLVAALRAQSPTYQELQRKHAALAEQYKALETRALSQSGATGIDAAKAVAELRQRIDRLDTTDRDAAFKTLGDALAQLDKTVALRTEQLREYVETSPKILALDQAVAQQEGLVGAALKKLDQADGRLFDELEQKLAEQRELRRKLIETEGLRDSSRPIAVVDAAIKQLLERQSPYQAGHARAANGPTGAEAVKLARAVAPAAPAGANAAISASSAGERMVLTVKGVEVPVRYCPPTTLKPFRMGSTPGDADAHLDEEPVDVTFTSGFWIAEVECSQKLWKAFMGPADAKWRLHGKGDLLPAYGVSHDEATEFAREFNQELRNASPKMTGWKAVLPSEAQWEYAARAGSVTRFCFGDDAATLGDYAWYEGNSNVTHHPVGTKKPNAWGIHDMHGSVWEWTADWYSHTLAGGTNPAGPKTGSDRVHRGGSLWCTPRSCRSAFRRRSTPAFSLEDTGFRLALVQEGSGGK